MLVTSTAIEYYLSQPDNRMNIDRLLLFTAAMSALFATIPGCGANSLDRMFQAGQRPLSAESLHSLVAGNNVHLTAIDFDAQVLFKENQNLTAKNRSGEMDTGKWDITSDNLVCLDFDTWYFGDVQCYSVTKTPEGDAYIFFTENGARAYSAEVLDTIPASLISHGIGKKRTSYLKERNSTVAAQAPREIAPEVTVPEPPPAPEPSPEEMKRILITTARNCPACNFAGVDFRGAELIGANLAGANLAGADLSGADLRRADLSGANLENATLRATNLPGANLKGCNLTQADLRGANLIKANLSGSATKDALFTDALLEGTTGIK